MNQSNNKFMEQEKQNKETYYLDVLRVISSFLVIVVHSAAQEWNSFAVKSVNWQVLNVYDCLAISGVPVFFMISGALLLNEKYVISIRKLYFKKILHLFLVYHFLLIFYNLVPFFMGERMWTLKNIKADVLYDTLTGNGAYHLWFIPQLLCLYMITPLLKETFRKKEICEYFLALYFIVGAVLPALLLFDIPYKNIISSYCDRGSWGMLTGYIGYYVAGHYIHSFIPVTLTKRRRNLVIAMTVFAYMITILACSLDAIHKNEPSTILNTPLAAPHFVSAIGLFLLVRHLCRNLRNERYMYVKQVVSLSFGIYLMHPFVITVVKKVGFSTGKLHPIIMVPFFAMIIYLSSMLLVFLLKKIPVVKKVFL